MDEKERASFDRALLAEPTVQRADSTTPDIDENIARMIAVMGMPQAGG